MLNLSAKVLSTIIASNPEFYAQLLAEIVEHDYMLKEEYAQYIAQRFNGLTEKEIASSDTTFGAPFLYDCNFNGAELYSIVIYVPSTLSFRNGKMSFEGKQVYGKNDVRNHHGTSWYSREEYEQTRKTDRRDVTKFFGKNTVELKVLDATQLPIAIVNDRQYQLWEFIGHATFDVFLASQDA